MSLIEKWNSFKYTDAQKAPVVSTIVIQFLELKLDSPLLIVIIRIRY